MFKTSALQEMFEESVSIEHWFEPYRDETHVELSAGQEGFKEFFGAINSSLKQLSIRCSAWFRLRPPLTDVKSVKRALDSADVTYDDVFQITVPYIPHTDSHLIEIVDWYEQKEKIITEIHKLIPVAITRYSGYINRIDNLANSLPEPSLWTGFKYDYNEVVTDIQERFQPKMREGRSIFNDVCRSLGEFVEAGTRLDALNQRVQSMRPSVVRTDIDRLIGVLGRLHAHVKESKLSDAWKEQISNDVQLFAKWTEFYAITLKQFMDVTLATVGIGKELLKHK